MDIKGSVVIEGMATIENLPISNNSLSAVVQTNGSLFKRELGTISTASKESYIPGLSVAFPSIFNLNTESLDYNNRNLVVSLKNQLQGTVFMAPVSMNGTPAFRRMLKSDLTDASVLFSDDPRISNWDTAYNRGDFRDYGLGRLNSLNKVTSLMNTLESGLYGSASSDTSSPISGSSGSFLHMRSPTSGNNHWSQLWILSNNSTEPRAFISHGSDTRLADWEELWHSGNFTPSDYVKKSGDTMSGVLNLSGVNSGIVSDGSVRPIILRNMPSSTGGWARLTAQINLGGNVIDSMGHYGSPTSLSYGWIGGGINYNDKHSIRWTADGKVGIGLNSYIVPSEALDVVGTIKTSSHGTSENWKQAYDRGDFKDYGLGKYVVPATPMSDVPNATGFYFVTDPNDIIPGVTGKNAKVIRLGNSSHSNNTSSFILGHNSNELGYKYTDTAPTVRLWTSANLRSNEENDYRYNILAKNASDVHSKNFYSTVRDIDANLVVGNVSLYPSSGTSNVIGQSHLHSFGVNANYGWQLNKQSTGTDLFIRTNINKNWTDWDKFWRSGNLVNPATQDWVNSQGYSTQTLTAGSNIQINGSVISATNTTYSTASLAELTTGTVTTGRLHSPKNLNDWLNSKGYVTTDTTYTAGTLPFLELGNSVTNCVWSPKVLSDFIKGNAGTILKTNEGGILVKDWSSTANNQGAIALGIGAYAGGANSLAMLKNSAAIGPNNIAIGNGTITNGLYSLGIGSFNSAHNTSFSLGLGLQTSEYGCTAIGVYNEDESPGLGAYAPNSTRPAFVVGGGLSSVLRKNLFNIYKDGSIKLINRMYYEEGVRDSIDFTDENTIPDIKYLKENGSMTTNPFDLLRYSGETIDNPIGLDSYADLSIVVMGSEFSGNYNTWRLAQGAGGHGSLFGVYLKAENKVLIRGYYKSNYTASLPYTLVYNTSTNQIQSNVQPTAVTTTQLVLGNIISSQGIVYFNPRR